MIIHYRMFQDVFNNTNGYIHIESKDLISTQFECNMKNEAPRHIGQRIGPKMTPSNRHLEKQTLQHCTIREIHLK